MVCGPPTVQLSFEPAAYHRLRRQVNSVSPGPTRTEGTEAMGDGVEQLAAQGPARRPATADEIAEAIVFLATDRSSFIYGAKLAVDGGAPPFEELLANSAGITRRADLIQSTQRRE
jgi:NAD(P)-dependent dehydrogenase (short-subunit alcohol dehydrogenase family)